MAEEKKTVSAKQVVADIRAGATDEFLMKKYGLAEKGLKSLFQKLIVAKVITQGEIDRRKSADEEVEAVVVEDKAADSQKEKSVDVLKDFSERFKFSKEDLERLKTASLKDIKQLMAKYKISVGDSKELLKTLGISAGSLLTQAAGKLKDGTRRLREEVQQRQSTGEEEDQFPVQPKSSETPQEKLKKVGGQAFDKATELGDKVAGSSVFRKVLAFVKISKNAASAEDDRFGGSTLTFKGGSWFEQRWIVFTALLLTYPVGLYGLWKTSRFQVLAKAIMAGVLLLPNIIFIQQLIVLWCLLGLGAGIYVLWRSSLTGATKKIASVGIMAAAVVVVWVALPIQTHQATAVKWFRKSADQGNAGAQNKLGLMYLNGDGVPKDYAEAVKWFRKSADQGNAMAQSNLGLMYRKGDGVPKDYAEAVKWFSKAADQGNAGAQNNLGLMYHEGDVVPKDYAEAVKWFRKAADQGDATAQSLLGLMYHDGDGVPKDYAEAVKWFRKATDQGNAGAQYSLGLMYKNGTGVAKDQAGALKWFTKAADQGHEDAKKELRNLGAKSSSGTSGVNPCEAVKEYMDKYLAIWRHSRMSERKCHETDHDCRRQAHIEYQQRELGRLQGTVNDELQQKSAELKRQYEQVLKIPAVRIPLEAWEKSVVMCFELGIDRGCSALRQFSQQALRGCETQ